jgi:hypothetical protein
MFPHLDTESRITDMLRQETVAKAARYRAARRSVVHDGARRASRGLWKQIGAALVQAGQHLQGTRPVKPACGDAAPPAFTGASR